MPKQAIRPGCRGPIVYDIQKALGVKPDGLYGALETAPAVIALQRKVGLEENGQATPEVFGLLGMAWPTDYELCLQLTGQYESTGGDRLGFGGVNKTDIDGAGVTLGIAGFTTEHGEVQWLLREWFEARPEAFAILPGGAREGLEELCKDPRLGREKWEAWFFGRDGKVDEYIRDVFREWGKHGLFQKLQKDRIYQDKWLSAMEHAKALRLKTIYGWGLMFDIQVQNGGWKDKHRRIYNQMTNASVEAQRLENIAKAVAQASIPKWQKDVLTRKRTFATGGGVVHGRNFILTEYGFPKEGLR